MVDSPLNTICTARYFHRQVSSGRLIVKIMRTVFEAFFIAAFISGISFTLGACTNDDANEISSSMSCDVKTHCLVRILFTAKDIWPILCMRQIILCRQLFSYHVVGSRPMKRKNTMHRKIIEVLSSADGFVNDLIVAYFFFSRIEWSHFMSYWQRCR